MIRKKYKNVYQNNGTTVDKTELKPRSKFLTFQRGLQTTKFHAFLLIADVLVNLVTFTQPDGTLEYAAFEGERLIEIQLAFYTTATEGVLVHVSGDSGTGYVQIRLNSTYAFLLIYFHVIVLMKLCQKICVLSIIKF